MMDAKILTLDNLYQFFVEQNKDFNFSSKENKCPIVVSIPGNFESSEEDMPGMLKVKLKVCHTELNRNGSFISEENMKKAMPTLKYRPILAYIHQLENGTWDFYAHNMEIVEDENGEEQINYLEKQVGCFTVDEPYLEYDKKMDKTYVNAYAVIPEDYTQAADIIRRKNGTKVSCELVINELAYNAKEKYLDLTDFYFGGTTLLGRDEKGNEIGEGMLGARADIAEFCHEVPVFNYQEKLVEALEKLNITLEAFTHKTNEEGGDKGMDKFNELLEQYGKTVEDIDFEYEGLTDEELEAKFEEVFGEGDETVVEEPVEETVEETIEESVEEPVVEEPAASDSGEEQFESNKKFSLDENGNMILTYEISHEDTRCALYNLLSMFEEEDNEWYFITNVYDEYFIFENWEGSILYKQGYAIDGDNVSFSGERVQMFKMILSESEKLAIEKMRGDYAELETKYNELKEFKDQYDANEIKAKKDEIFSKEEYSILSENEDFKKLKEEASNFSIEEIEAKAKSIFADHVIATGKFSANVENKPTAMHFSVKTVDTANTKPYGNLFDM